MRVNPWFTVSLLFLIVIESISVLSWSSYGIAITVITLLFASLFFGFFFFFFLSSTIGSSIDDWIKDIERGEGIVAPGLYLTWLYENDRRKWAVWETIISAISSLFFGSLLFYGAFAYDILLPAYFIGVGFLVVLAVCWFEAYWKPRTRKLPTEIPESVKAEWTDKRL